jgi:hypothetical protein
MERSEWVNEHRVLAQDRRTLLVLERGDPDGHTVLVHNGTPNSRLMFDRVLERHLDEVHAWLLERLTATATPPL